MSIELRMNTVAEMQKNSQICHELFPEQKHDPVITGELLFLIRSGRQLNCNKEQVRSAGVWWLWARDLFILNTITKPMNKVMALMVLEAVKSKKFVHFVTTRSPELVHAQVARQADKSLPRSRKALGVFSEVINQSSRFLPTIGTILLADVAIDNFEEILKVQPDLEKVINENLQKLEAIIFEQQSPNINIARMSHLFHPSGKTLGDIINPDGSINLDLDFSTHAENLIAIATRESADSHKRMFGWSAAKSQEHNRNLAKTMALVGQAVKITEPPAILIHNEAFISRGALNNLLVEPSDPLPVICLKTLLENKTVANR